MREITITFTEAELEGIKLSLETSAEYLQEQKSSISGAMIGHSKIDAICRDLGKIKDKINSHLGS